MTHAVDDAGSANRRQAFLYFTRVKTQSMEEQRPPESLPHRKDPGEIMTRTAFIQAILAMVCVVVFPVFTPFVLAGIAMILAFLSRGYESRLAGRAKAAVIANIAYTAWSVTGFVSRYQNDPAFHQEMNRQFQQMSGMDLDQYFEELQKELTGGESETL